MIKDNKRFIICKHQYRDGMENIELENIKSQVKRNRSGNFIILDEEIYIKEYNTIKIKEIKYIIDNEIKQELSSDDYLIHFSIDYKGRKTFIYAIKGGDKLSPFLDYIKKIKVTPIQFLILKGIRRNIKKKNFESVIEVNDKYYYIKVKNNIIIKNLLFTSKEDSIKNNNIITGKFGYPFKNKNLIIGEN